jgi:hypothetical protein
MKRRSFVSSVLAIALVALFSSAARAGVSPQPFRTGLFGITPGQAIRVSVLNAGNVGGIITPCFNPNLAGFVVKVSGPAGRVLFESQHKEIRQGTGTFTDFEPTPEDGITGPGGAVVRARRIQLRAEVAIELQPIPEDGIPVPNDGQCADDAVARRHARRLLRNVHLTLEIYDVATGKTAFTMPFSEVMFNPQPEPPEPIAVP